MDYKEAIDKLVRKCSNERIDLNPEFAIENTLDILMALVELATPKKLIIKEEVEDLLDTETFEEEEFIIENHYCPKCNEFVVEEIDKNYCGNCGQRLDWGEDDE